MKRLFLLQILLASVLMLLCIDTQAQTRAIPADRKPRTITQPDSTTLTIRIHGDERLHYVTTDDGYTIMQNSDKIYVYAKKDRSGRLTPGKTKASDKPSRKLKEKIYLITVRKDIRSVSLPVREQSRKAARGRVKPAKLSR